MDANLLSIFITVGIAHFLALLSPGPDFVLIVKYNTPRKLDQKIVANKIE